MSVRAFFSLLAAVSVAIPLSARGQDEEGDAPPPPPVVVSSGGGGAGGVGSFVSRGLVLPAGTLRVDVAPPDFALQYGGIGGASVMPDLRGMRIGRTFTGQTVFSVGAGAGFGITEQLEAGLLLLPIPMAPDFDFGDIEAYGRFAFLQDESLQIGAQVDVAIPTATSFGTGLGVPVLLRFDNVRLDTGAQLELIFGDNFRADLDIPVAGALQVTPELHVGGRTGLFVVDFEEVAIPLGVYAGYELPLGGIDMDVVLSWIWPHFIWSGPGDNIDLDHFDITLGARMHFAMM